MTIAIASDHGGFALKTYLINYFANQGVRLDDLGTHSEESCDYPLIADKLCRYVLE
ncbi:MAG: RpiB/LacA/LacB family sugar-phosphate isomerase, partial [Alphaproteobacteria bacterium]|nr:RpiB/LacA/LacB family sugar-phosphate isomerase [Alphaproteobacteria bacterium]